MSYELHDIISKPEVLAFLELIVKLEHQGQKDLLEDLLGAVEDLMPDYEKFLK
jgi:hypothetical protein